jgi:hypothetical protein
VQEIALVVGVLASYMLLGLLPWQWLLGGGILMVALGLVVGLPASAWYHVRLYRGLKRQAAVEKLWWLRPYLLHERVDGHDRGAVVWWFRFGAGCFGVALAGCLLVLVGAWRSQ